MRAPSNSSGLKREKCSKLERFAVTFGFSDDSISI